MKRLLFYLAVLLVHSVYAENPAQPVLRVNRMKATNNSGGKVEIDSSMFFKNNADRDDFVANLNLGTPSTFPWASITGKPTTVSGFGITDVGVVRLTGLDGLTGGANKLDGVSIAPLAVGTVVCFDITGTEFFYVVSDDGDLPAEDGGNFILPDAPSGTKYWCLVSSLARNGANGERFLDFGNAETTTGSFYPTAYGYIATLTSGSQWGFNLTPTWNGVGQTFTLLRGRVTDTNSAAGSLLLDLGTAAGGSKVSVDKSGNMTLSTSLSVPTVTGSTSVDGVRLRATGTTGNGYVEIPTQSSNPSIAANKLRMWSAAGPGTLSSLFVNYDDGGAPTTPTISFVSANNGTRTYTFPNSATALMQYDSDLNALANNSSNGFWSHISAGNGSARTLVAGSSKISITNGDGVAGNPSFDLVEANLTFSDSTPIVKGSGDATKLLRFEVDGFTTGTTRVVTFPNADITVARTDAANTFTGLQTFNTGITASGSGNIDIKSSNSASFGGTGSASATLTSASTTTVSNTGSGSVVLTTSGGSFSLNSSAHFVPSADNSRDIGATSFAVRETFTRGIDSGSANDLVLQRNNVTGLTLAAAANISALPVRLKGYTVAGLPAGTQGDLAFVTDASAPTYNATVAGGGAVVIPVFYNGTNWVCH